MLIHHMTDGVRYVTQVTLSFSESKVTHFKEGNVHKDHRKMIAKLENNGRVFVPILTKAKLVDRTGYENYLGDL